MIGKRVQIYFNLHKKVFSVRCKKTRLVIAHVNNICLEDVVFKVSEKGRQRVIREQRKNVHAIVEGTVIESNTALRLYSTDKITYNPYKYDSFVYKYNEKAIKNCEKLNMKVENKIPTIEKITIIW